MNNFDKPNARTGARTAFAVSTALLLYTVVGYPLLVGALSRLRPRPVRKQEGELPKVSIIIAAYNEEAAIHAKLENTFALDYPADRLEIIVASDCSSDRTDEIVCTHPRCDGGTWGSVRLCRLPERGGKTAAQNFAAEQAQGEILVFSDATSDYEPNVLKVIIPNFADSEVGCVSGRMIYVDPSKSGVGSGAQSYWNYEVFIKSCESQIFSLIGVSGLLYAVRKSVFRALPPESSSDFVIATDVVSQGYRVIFEQDAICREETNKRVGRELKMRTRIITQTYYDLWWMRSMMNPLRSGFYAVQLWSHKVFRYAVPLFLLINSLASWRIAGQSKFHRALVGLQALICLTAAIGSLLERTSARGHRVTQLLAIPRYFLFNNAAPFMALWNVLQGERYAKWDTARESTPESSSTKAGDE
jgi:cellulose synthase/poly-beta-1,6-N-acetylglucosamine synthase-like glycosyltransferase